VAQDDIDTSHNACAVVLLRLYALIKAYIHTQQSGNANDYIEMYEIFNPEIPGLEPPNPEISVLRKMSGIPVLESLAVGFDAVPYVMYLDWAK
jgi:hypothetical protein